MYIVHLKIVTPVLTYLTGWRVQETVVVVGRDTPIGRSYAEVYLNIPLDQMFCKWDTSGIHQNCCCTCYISKELYLTLPHFFRKEEFIKSPQYNTFLSTLFVAHIFQDAGSTECAHKLVLRRRRQRSQSNLGQRGVKRTTLNSGDRERRKNNGGKMQKSFAQWNLSLRPGILFFKLCYSPSINSYFASAAAPN
jgi:hypothetical protein